MAYDKKSFLAGLTMGRNMASWPVMEGGNLFRFTVRATGGSTFYTPYMVFDGVILWGDGAATSFKNIPYNYSGYDERVRGRESHIYADTGEYQISLVGDLRDWATVRAAGIIENNYYLISIDTPFPASMIKRGCYYRMCWGSKSLHALPSKLFKQAPPNANVDRGLGDCFYGCPALQHIPGDLLDGCEEVTQMSRMFIAGGLLEIPPELFSFTPNAQEIGGFFGSNSGITRIPYGLLDPMPELTNVSNLFGGTGITDIPSGLFRNNPAIKNFAYCFQGTNITGIPSGLFGHAAEAETFTSCFYGCTDVAGDVPRLWEIYQEADGSGCFEGCSNATNWAEIPTTWGGPLEVQS